MMHVMYLKRCRAGAACEYLGCRQRAICAAVLSAGTTEERSASVCRRHLDVWAGRTFTDDAITDSLLLWDWMDEDGELSRPDTG